MELFFFILLVATFFLGKKIWTLKKDIEEANKKHENQIRIKNDSINSLTHERDIARSKVASCKEENERLRKILAETNRKLDFYKNIEEDSSALNSSEDDLSQKNLLQQATQQINSIRSQLQTSPKLHDNDIEHINSLLDSEQLNACNEMEYSNRNFFISGKAGTGKSFLLDVFRYTTRKSHIVLAPTGMAALNVHGATLHSTFGYYNLVDLDVDMISLASIRLKSEKKLVLKQVSTIIIDEISMVRADTFDKIDRILKAINENNLPFGGKQLLLFGDLFQLPPISKSKETQYLIDRYDGIHVFCSDAYKNGNFSFFELTINHRQKDDAKYFDLLNRIRDGSATSDDIDLINTRVTHDTSIYDRFTTLLPTKAEAEVLNQQHIDSLDSTGYTYKAKITLDKYPNKNHNLESVFPISSSLHLKKGVLVMMVSNDSNGRWVNGTLGIVNKLSDNRVCVAIKGYTYDILPSEFTEQEITYTEGKITYENVLKVTQYPLVPAYAITIHKSQGQTYQNIVCDINGCFANGQAYVALSRCESLNGLHLKTPINHANIHVDKTVLDFYHKQKANF